MAQLVRALNRTLLRRFSTFKQAVQEEEAHALGTMKTWKSISLFVAIPALTYCVYNAIRKEAEHSKHGRAEFVPYTHLRIRNKPFPWGDGNHTLIHNAHTNPLPEGYEE